MASRNVFVTGLLILALFNPAMALAGLYFKGESPPRVFLDTTYEGDSGSPVQALRKSFPAALGMELAFRNVELVQAHSGDRGASDYTLSASFLSVDSETQLRMNLTVNESGETSRLGPFYFSSRESALSEIQQAADEVVREIALLASSEKLPRIAICTSVDGVNSDRAKVQLLPVIPLKLPIPFTGKNHEDVVKSYLADLLNADGPNFKWIVSPSGCDMDESIAALTGNILFSTKEALVKADLALDTGADRFPLPPFYYASPTTAEADAYQSLAYFVQHYVSLLARENGGFGYEEGEQPAALARQAIANRQAETALLHGARLPDGSPERRSILEQGYLIEGNIEAANWIRDEGSRAPVDADLILLRAEAYAQRGELRQAAEQLNAGLKLHPGNTRLLMELGNLYAYYDDKVSPEQFFQRVLEIEPDNVRALYRMGTWMSSEGRRDEAAEYFARAMEVDPDFSPARIAHMNMLYERALLMGEEGNYGEGLALYDEILDCERTLGSAVQVANWAYLNSIESLIILGRYDEARQRIRNPREFYSQEDSYVVDFMTMLLRIKDGRPGVSGLVDLATRRADVTYLAWTFEPLEQWAGNQTPPLRETLLRFITGVKTNDTDMILSTADLGGN